MFDLLLTIAVIYFAYRGYQWYTHMQNQVKGGPKPHDRIDVTPPESGGSEDDYVDYEEVK